MKRKMRRSEPLATTRTKLEDLEGANPVRPGNARAEPVARDGQVFSERGFLPPRGREAVFAGRGTRTGDMWAAGPSAASGSAPSSGNARARQLRVRGGDVDRPLPSRLRDEVE